MFHSTFSLLYTSPFNEDDFYTLGSAFVGSNEIILTKDTYNQRGLASLKDRILSKYFNITVEFELKSKRLGSHGDGIALWLTPTKIKTGNALGGQETWKGLGIFVDTFHNSKTSNPTIQIIYNNNDLKYNYNKDGKDITQRSCNIKQNRLKTNTLTVIYNNGKITVYSNNLLCSKFEQQLEQGTVVSLSGMTSEVTDIQTIRSINVKDMTPLQTKYKGPAYLAPKIDLITKQFTELELGKESLYNLNIILETIKETELSLETTKKFVSERNEKLKTINSSLKKVSKVGFSLESFDKYVSIMKRGLGELYDFYDEITEETNNLIEKIRKSTVLKEEININSLTLWDILICINNVVLSLIFGYMSYRIYKTRHFHRKF